MCLFETTEGMCLFESAMGMCLLHLRSGKMERDTVQEMDQLSCYTIYLKQQRACVYFTWRVGKWIKLSTRNVTVQLLRNLFEIASTLNLDTWLLYMILNLVILGFKTASKMCTLMMKYTKFTITPCKYTNLQTHYINLHHPLHIEKVENLITTSQLCTALQNS